jgi:L-2,4-diaminobutyrate decarboxylase
MSEFIYSGAAPDQVAADLAPLLDFQEEGLPLAELEAMIATRLLPHLMRYDRPQFQSMFNAFPGAEARLGAEIALRTNQGVTNWQVSPGGATLEELCARALCRLFGLGEEAEATFMYSGTYGNQQALYMALHRHAQGHGFDLAQEGIAGFAAPERLAILVSESAHFSLRHAVRILGLGERSLVTLPMNEQWRVDAHQLQDAVHALAAEREIVCLVATAGSTSTGAVDPLAAMAALAEETGAWLHVDGAYGYAYKLVPEWSSLFAGDGLADSITWDPHKQLGAPIPNSLLFVRRRADFGRMALHSDYFNRAEDREPNPGLKSPPSTRPLSALPLVAILRGQGLRQVIAGLRVPLVAIRTLAEDLQNQRDFEPLHWPDTGILCFRYVGESLAEERLDAIQRRLYQAVMASGRRTISLTKLGGKQALRLVTISPQTSIADLRETIEELRRIAHGLRG